MTVGKPAQRTQREFRVSTQVDGWQILLTELYCPISLLIYSHQCKKQKTNFVSQRQKSLVRLNLIPEMLVTQGDRLS